MSKPQKKPLWIEKIEKPISKINNIENKKKMPSSQFDS